MFKLPQIFKKSSALKTFLTVDIGSDYVKCLVFKYSDIPDTPKLQIVGKGKQPLGALQTRGGGIVDLEGVTLAVDQSIKEALSEATITSKDVIFGVSGEMTKGLVTTVRLTRPHADIPISEQEFANIISKIEESAYIEASQEIAQMTGNPDMEISLTNSSVSSVKVNDTFVKDPLGLACERLEIGLFTAFTPVYHLELLQKVASKLKLKILTVTSEMYALSKWLSSEADTSNMVLVDIGGETTDVGVIFGGSLVSTRTLSIGGRHITKQISEVLGTTLLEAEEKKLRYSMGVLPEEDANRIHSVIKDVIDLWISGIELVFSDFDGVKTFPSQVLLVGGGSSLRDLVEAMYKEPWTRNIPFKEPPSFARVSIQSLQGIADFTGKVTGNDDVMPAAISEVFLEMQEQ